MTLKAPEIRISGGAPLSVVERYVERALHYYSKKRYEDALLDLEEAIRIQSNNGELYVTRAYILIEAGRPEEAAPDLEQGLKLDPRQWLAYYCRAMMAYEQEDYEAALAYCNQAQWIAPMRPEVYIYRAAIFYQKGEKGKAKKEIDAALQTMQPGDKRLKDARKWVRAIKKM